MNANKSFSTETSERYSRALFEVAQEANELEKIEGKVLKWEISIWNHSASMLKDKYRVIDLLN